MLYVYIIHLSVQMHYNIYKNAIPYITIDTQQNICNVTIPTQGNTISILHIDTTKMHVTHQNSLINQKNSKKNQNNSYEKTRYMRNTPVYTTTEPTRALLFYNVTSHRKENL